MTYTVLDTHTGRVVRVYAATREAQAVNLANVLNRGQWYVRYIVKPEYPKDHEPGSVLAVGPV